MVFFFFFFVCFFFQAEDGIRDLVRSRGLGDVYKRQGFAHCPRRGGFATLKRARRHLCQRRRVNRRKRNIDMNRVANSDAPVIAIDNVTKTYQMGEVEVLSLIHI